MKRLLVLTDVLQSMMDGGAEGDAAAKLAEADALGQVRLCVSAHDVATALEAAGRGGEVGLAALAEWWDFFLGFEIVEINAAMLSEALEDVAGLGLDPGASLLRTIAESSLVNEVVSDKWAGVRFPKKPRRFPGESKEEYRERQLESVWAASHAYSRTPVDFWEVLPVCEALTRFTGEDGAE